MVTVAEGDLPSLFQRADRTSARAQRAYKRWVEVDLSLVALAAVLSMATSLLPRWPAQAVSVISVVCLAGAIGVEEYVRRRRFEERWYDGRFVAESVKSSAWRYMMRVEPYEGSDEEASSTFEEVLKEALLARPDLQTGEDRISIAGQHVSACMREFRALPAELGRELYLQQRLLNQEGWYSRKSLWNRHRANLWSRANQSARLLALVYTVFFLFRPNAPHLTEVFATVAVSVTAWAQLGRHQELSRSYDVAARELHEIRLRLERAVATDDVGQHVIDAETAISREHTMWMTKRV